MNGNKSRSMLYFSLCLLTTFIQESKWFSFKKYNISCSMYSKTCVKQPLKIRQYEDLFDNNW